MTTRMKLFIAGMALMPLLLAAAVCGGDTTRIENTPPDQVRGITVAGEGKVTGEPDLALITVGVSTLRPTVAEARDAAATALTGILDSMRANGVADDDLQTSQLSIYPEYNYNNDGSQTLRGFRVNNTVNAKLRDIDRTSEVVDDAVAAGGDETTIQGIAFTIDNPESLRQQAREAAVADAKSKAETLASASGVQIGNPINISESGGFEPIPYAERAALAGDSAQAAPSTPIEPGELDVIITVSVTWEIQQ